MDGKVRGGREEKLKADEYIKVSRSKRGRNYICGYDSSNLPQALLHTQNLLPVANFRSLLEYGIQYRSDLLIDREQYPATEDRPSQPHRRPSPKTSDPIISQNASKSVHGTSPLGALRPRLERVERLSRIRRDCPRHRSVRKVRHRTLRDLSTVFVVLEDVVRTHAERRSARLLESGADESAVEPQNPMLGVDDPHGLRCGAEAFRLGPRVVDQGRLDPLRWRDGKDAREDAGAHAGQHVAQRRQGACFGVLEGVLDQVEGEEANAIFCDGPDDQGGTTLV